MSDSTNDKPVPLYCFCCGRCLHRDECCGHYTTPVHAVLCTSTGNYGSTVYDPMNGIATFYICDVCFSANKWKAHVEGEEIGDVPRRTLEQSSSFINFGATSYCKDGK